MRGQLQAPKTAPLVDRAAERGSSPLHWRCLSYSREPEQTAAAYLDRTNLSVAIRGLSVDMGFAGESFAVTSSWALTSFLVLHVGFVVLGALVILGGFALLAYGPLASRQVLLPSAA